MKAFTYQRADTTAHAADAAVKPGAKIIAGGTNLLDLMKLQVETPSQLVDINRLPLDKIEETTDGGLQVRYSSGVDLLRQTPEFVRETRVERLEREFEHAYRYVEPLFTGKNPYLEAIDRNLGYLHRVLRTERWPMLRRNPPLFTSGDNQLGQVRGLMLNHLKALWA